MKDKLLIESNVGQSSKLQIINYRNSSEQKMAKTRIMYIENKSGENELFGDARIGRVTFSKTGKSIHYNGQTFQTLNGKGFKANYFDVNSGNYYWISGCKKDGTDRLYGERLPIYIDDDIREKYWTDIRRKPENKDTNIING